MHTQTHLYPYMFSLLAHNTDILLTRETVVKADKLVNKRVHKLLCHTLLMPAMFGLGIKPLTIVNYKLINYIIVNYKL